MSTEPTSHDSDRKAAEPLVLKDRIPTIEEAKESIHAPLCESYWWLDGLNFNRPVICSVSISVHIKHGPSVRVYFGHETPVAGFESDHFEGKSFRMWGPIPLIIARHHAEERAAADKQRDEAIKAHGVLWNAVRRAAAAFRWIGIPKDAHAILAEDAERIFEAEKITPEWSTDWAIISRQELTALRTASQSPTEGPR